jgi:hypothetical protein
MIDDTLLRARHVLRALESDGGYDVHLECGHRIWMAVAPAVEVQCGACLNKLIDQVRNVQAHQKMEEG